MKLLVLIALSVIGVGGCSADQSEYKGVYSAGFKRNLSAAEVNGRTSQEIADELACRIWTATFVQMYPTGPCVYEGSKVLCERGFFSTSLSAVPLLTMRVTRADVDGSFMATVQFPALQDTPPSASDREMEVLRNYAHQMRTLWDPLLDATAASGPIAGKPLGSSLARFREQFGPHDSITAAFDGSTGQ